MRRRNYARRVRSCSSGCTLQTPLVPSQEGCRYLPSPERIRCQIGCVRSYRILCTWSKTANFDCNHAPAFIHILKVWPDLARVYQSICKILQDILLTICYNIVYFTPYVLIERPQWESIQWTEYDGINVVSKDLEKTDWSKVHISWHLRGFLLWNVSAALCAVTWARRHNWKQTET